MTFLELFDSNYHFEICGKRINIDLRSAETKMIDDIRDNFSDLNEQIRKGFHDAAMDRLDKLVISHEMRAELMQRIAGRQLIVVMLMPCATDRTMQILSISMRTNDPDNPETLTAKVPKQP